MIHADELLLLAEEETALQGATDRLTEIRGCCGMELNGRKVRFDNPNTNVHKTVYDGSKTTGESEIFLAIWVTRCKMYTWNVTQNCQCKSNIQQEEDSCQLPIWMKCKENENEMLYSEHSFVWL